MWSQFKLMPLPQYAFCFCLYPNQTTLSPENVPWIGYEHVAVADLDGSQEVIVVS